MPENDTRSHTPRRASTQFLALVNELADEIGRTRGWQSAVARRIGVHRSTLLKLLRGERAVTATLIDRAARALSIDPRFFAQGVGQSFSAWTVVPATAELDVVARFSSLDRPNRERVIVALLGADEALRTAVLARLPGRAEASGPGEREGRR